MKDKGSFFFFFCSDFFSPVSFLSLEKSETMDCFSLFKRIVGPTCATVLLNDWWNHQKKIWFNVKCHHLRKGGSKQRHAYSLQLWWNFCLVPCQSQEKLKGEADQSFQLLPVVLLALTPRFWTQHFTVKRPRKCSVYEQVQII